MLVGKMKQVLQSEESVRRDVRRRTLKQISCENTAKSENYELSFNDGVQGSRGEVQGTRTGILFSAEISKRMRQAVPLGGRLQFMKNKANHGPAGNTQGQS